MSFMCRHRLYALVRRELAMTGGDFRRHVAACSATVEQQHCARKLEEVEYAKLPSLALCRYCEVADLDVAAVFCLILERARAAKLPAEEMPACRTDDVRASLEPQAGMQAALESLLDKVDVGAFVPLLPVLACRDFNPTRGSNARL